MNVGCEYVFNKMFSIRAGYKTLFNDESEEGLGLGAGMSYPLGSMRLMLDYAYHDFGVLNDIQKITIGLGF